MTDPYVGEIRMFAGTFAPVNWMFCRGQLLTITDYPDLFAVLGAVWGGDGRSSFGLPDFRSRVPMQWGTGPGLTERTFGQTFGSERVTLTLDQIPPHNHNLMASTDDATKLSPEDMVPGTPTDGTKWYATPLDKVNKVVPFADEAIAPAGSGSTHYNIMPFIAMNYIMCVKGPFPPRN